MKKLKKDNPAFFICLMLLVLLIQGCPWNTKPGMIDSFVHTTTDYDKHGLLELPQYSVMMVSGMLPFSSVGDPYFYKPRREPFSSIGLSQSNESFYAVRLYDIDEDGFDALINLRDELLEARDLASQLIEIKLQMLQIQDTIAKTKGDECKAKVEELKKEIKSYATVNGQFIDANRRASKLLKKSGIIVCEWDSSRKIGHKGGTGEEGPISMDVSSKKRKRGLVLIGGIRTVTLFVGNDIEKSSRNLIQESAFRNNFLVPTTLIQAKHVIWIANFDLESQLEAKLSASYEQLSDISKTIKDLTKIEIETTMSRLTSLTNMGAMSKPVGKTSDPIKWELAELKKRLEGGGWLTLYSVNTELKEIIELLWKHNSGVCKAPNACPKGSNVSAQ